MRLKTLALIILLLPALAGPARALPWDNRPKILLHLAAPTTKSPCAADGPGALADCQQAVVRGEIAARGVGPYYFAYLLAARGQLAGLSGLQCGLQYQDGQSSDMDDQMGIDIFGWNLCATLEFPTTGLDDWPRPGSGNMITWDYLHNCQAGELGVAGYFYMASYTDDRLMIVPRPVDGVVSVADCDNVEYPLDPATDLGIVVFGSEELVPCSPCGYPCNAEPVQSSTWSQIKTLIHP